jgi:hypothetical protein
MAKKKKIFPIMKKMVQFFVLSFIGLKGGLHFGGLTIVIQ